MTRAPALPEFTVVITTSTGPQPVLARRTATPHLVLTRPWRRDARSGSGWCLTHVPTGMLMVPVLFPNLVAARTAAREFMETGVPLEFTGEARLTKHQRQRLKTVANAQRRRWPLLG